LKKADQIRRTNREKERNRELLGIAGNEETSRQRRDKAAMPGNKKSRWGKRGRGEPSKDVMAAI